MIQKGFYGKLFQHLYDPEIGPITHDWYHPNEWFNITKTLPDLDHYIFGDFAFIDDETCLLSYIRYTGTVGGSGSVPEGYGVLKGEFQAFNGEEPVWTWTDWSDGLPEGDGRTTYVTQMLHSSYRGERIFLTAARGDVLGGGLYMLEGPNFNNWVEIISANVENTYWNQYRDFRSLAQSENGSWLYVGTRGFSSGIGGLLLCKDPSHASDMSEWEILANDPDNTVRPFRFYENLPFWSADFLHWADPLSIDKKMTYVSSIAVDRDDRKVVYISLRDQGMSNRSGLWKYDGKSWSHLSPDQPFKGMGVSVLRINPLKPSQLLVGTDGQGLYIGDIGE